MRTNDLSTGQDGPTLASLVSNMSYEVMPFKKTEAAVLADVPTSVPLTVTATEAKGISVTLDLAERLTGHGYTVAPHLPARQFVDDQELAEVMRRLRDASMRSVFVIGGDAPEPAGRFTDAHTLLVALHELGHDFDNIGIGGYPEGHAKISASDIETALKQKAPYATRVITQICFDAKTTASWAAGIARAGITLPVDVGMPGPVNRQKLMRISAGIGLGQSARFLQKQQNLFWRFLLPGGYNPTKLVKRLSVEAPKLQTNIRGLHIFTFNEIGKTEEWRNGLLRSAGA